MNDQNRQPKGTPTGGRFTASPKAESAVTLDTTTQATTPREALAPALEMNRVEAERHVRSLIDDAVASGDPQRIDDIASLASGPGWAGVAYVRGYPGASNPECEASDYLKTRAAATRTAEYALSRTVDAERRAAEQ
jgi:hypothetical protein